MFAVSESQPRLKAGLWVKMALRMGDRDGHPGAVLRRGDPDAGSVLVVLRGRDGLCVLSQTRTPEAHWPGCVPPAPCPWTTRRRTRMWRGSSATIPTSGYGI